MSWKERLFRSLPLVAALAGTTTFVVTDEQWTLFITLVGVWLMDSPIPGTIAVASALKRRPNVSRETSPRYELSDSETVHADGSPCDCEELDRTDPITAPCVVMHGSAEPHVLGCEGWRLPPE